MPPLRTSFLLVNLVFSLLSAVFIHEFQEGNGNRRRTGGAENWGHL